MGQDVKGLRAEVLHPRGGQGACPREAPGIATTDLLLSGKALAGMVTDRDITVRGVASGMIPQEALVSDVMTEEVRWCQETDTVEQVLAQMGDAQVRRLAVLNEAREVVGIVALGDLATRQSGDTDEALREISSPDQ